jgi:preflagellin peptidase FlaK
MIDIIASIASVAFLGCAAYLDIESRRVSNLLWILMLAVAIPLLLLRPDIYNIVSVAFMSLFALLLYYLGVMLQRFGFKHGLYGGADAKAIIALSVMMPEWPFGSDYPIFFSLSVILIAALSALVVPVALFVHNVRHGFRKMPDAFLAIEKEDFDEGKYWVYRKEEGKTLVTPKIPFILFLFIGLVVSLLLSL